MAYLVLENGSRELDHSFSLKRGKAQARLGNQTHFILLPNYIFWVFRVGLVDRVMASETALMCNPSWALLTAVVLVLSSCFMVTLQATA